MMKTIKVSEAKPNENPHGIDARGLYMNDHALISHLILQPGEKLIRHITPVDVFFYVLEGIGIVEVGDEKKIVSKDTLIESPKDIPHCWYNESDDILRILVGKVPKPTTSTKLL